MLFDATSQLGRKLCPCTVCLIDVEWTIYVNQLNERPRSSKENSFGVIFLTQYSTLCAYRLELTKAVTLPRTLKCAALHPNTKVFVTGSMSELWVRVYDYETEAEIGECLSHYDFPRSVDLAEMCVAVVQVVKRVIMDLYEVLHFHPSAMLMRRALKMELFVSGSLKRIDRAVQLIRTKINEILAFCEQEPAKLI